jgi:D-threo-aldose 1-dehydrogenase
MTARRTLSRSGLRVDAIGFGAVPLGNLYRALSEGDAQATVATAIGAGVRYFDTAPLYGLGLSERRLGLYLRELPRDEYILSTKVGRRLRPRSQRDQDGIFVEAPPFVDEFDFSHDGILRQVEDSLQRLGVDRLDCIVIHDLGLWHMKSDEVLEGHFKALESGGLRALRDLKDKGVIGCIGAGANELTLCDRFLELGEIDFILLALRYTLLDQSGRGFLERAHRRGVGIVVGAPFQSGILATGAIAGSHYNYATTPPEVLAKVERLQAFCSSRDVPLKAAALQFPLANEAVASVLVGMGSAMEVTENLAMANIEIPAAFWDELTHEHLVN